MVDFGYTMRCEQSGPKELVRDVRHAEAAGFDFAVISDHYFPWLDTQGHALYQGALAGELITYRGWHFEVEAASSGTSRRWHRRSVSPCRVRAPMSEHARRANHEHGLSLP